MNSKARITQEKILDAAIDVFSQNGFHGSSTAEIAKRAGCAEGTIFRYYGKKSDLLDAAVLRATQIFTSQRAVEGLAVLIEKSEFLTLHEFIKSIVLDRIRLVQDNWPLLKTIFYEMSFNDHIRQAFTENASSNLLSFGKELCLIMRRKGKIKKIDDTAIIRTLIGIVGSCLLQKGFFDDICPGPSLEQTVDTAVEIFINGISEV